MQPRAVMVLLPLCLLLTALPARAEIYKWVDANGRTQYSNAPPPAAAGRPQVVEERMSIMGMDPAVRAWAEQRFAQREREEALDWQQRQRALAAQFVPAQPPVVYSPYAYGRHIYVTAKPRHAPHRLRPMYRK